MIIVDATSAHLAAFYGGAPAVTCRAWAVLDGEQVLGVCGYFKHGIGNMVFTEMKPELRRHPRVMVSAGWRVLRHLAQLGKPVYAKCDQRIEAAERFLQHFGFARQPNGVFTWPA